MLKGYPLRKINWVDQLLMWGLSPLVLQVIVGFIFSSAVVYFNPPTALTEEAMLELVNLEIIRGAAIGTILSLPILIAIIVLRKVPIINRKRKWFIFPGLEAKDWVFLSWYIPVSYILFQIGGVVLELIFGGIEAPNQEAIESMVGIIPAWMLFLMIVVTAPIVEEWLFRGLIMFRQPHGEPTWAATIISALIFGMVHTPTDIPSAYTYIGMGLLFGYAAKRTQSIEAAIVYHLLNNVIGFIALMLL